MKKVALGDLQKMTKKGLTEFMSSNWSTLTGGPRPGSSSPGRTGNSNAAVPGGSSTAAKPTKDKKDKDNLNVTVKTPEELKEEEQLEAARKASLKSEIKKKAKELAAQQEKKQKKGKKDKKKKKKGKKASSSEGSESSSSDSKESSDSDSDSSADEAERWKAKYRKEKDRRWGTDPAKAKKRKKMDKKKKKKASKDDSSSDEDQADENEIPSLSKMTATDSTAWRSYFLTVNGRLNVRRLESQIATLVLAFEKTRQPWEQSWAEGLSNTSKGVWMCLNLDSKLGSDEGVKAGQGQEAEYTKEPIQALQRRSNEFQSSILATVYPQIRFKLEYMRKANRLRRECSAYKSRGARSSDLLHDSNMVCIEMDTTSHVTIADECCDIITAADAGLLLQKTSGQSNSDLLKQMEEMAVIKQEDVHPLKRSLLRHLDVLGTEEVWDKTNSVTFGRAIQKELLRQVLRDDDDGALDKALERAVKESFSRAYDNEKRKRKEKEKRKALEKENQGGGGGGGNGGGGGGGGGGAGGNWGGNNNNNNNNDKGAGGGKDKGGGGKKGKQISFKAELKYKKLTLSPTRTKMSKFIKI